MLFAIELRNGVVANNILIMKKIAVFPGSFDPFTVGHEEIVKRALSLFDGIIIAVGANALKKNYFSLDDRKDMITKTFKGDARVSVDHFEGLTVDYCKRVGASYILRGLRTSSDFEYERAIAQVNRQLISEIDTVFLLTKPDHTPVNSTIIRDIIRSGGDASQFVPSAVNLKDYKGQD